MGTRTLPPHDALSLMSLCDNITLSVCGDDAYLWSGVTTTCRIIQDTEQLWSAWNSHLVAARLAVSCARAPRAQSETLLRTEE